MKQIFLFATALFLLNAVSAATVDTLTLHSQSLGKDTKVVVILPNTYSEVGVLKYPVVYLLHGYTGQYSDWIRKVPSIKRYADKYQLIIICPDGENSWYIDSKSTPNSNYESYVGVELPRYISNHYHTYNDRNKTAITGLSMGGHGALYIAIHHKDTFGAVGSMSGVLDITGSRSGYNVSRILGDTTLATAKKYSDLYNVSQADTALAIIFDCGIEDPFINQNRAIHKRLMELKVPHHYSELPGGHTWPYWTNSIEYHLLFFRKYFDQ